LQVSKNREDRLLVQATYVSVGVALILIIVKTVAWLYTGSASILGSLIDSLMDSMASLITMLAVRYSIKPADSDHRFGHGKAESVAAIAQAAFVTGSGLFLLLYCLQHMLHREPYVVEHTPIGIALIVFAILLTLALLAFQSYVIQKTNSEAIRADRMHYKSDVLMNVVVIAALFSAYFGWSNIDLVFGILIACYISYGAVRIGYDAVQTLMDKELSPEIDAQILAVACKHPKVCGAHDLRTRQAGGTYIIQLHIELEDSTSLQQAHQISDEVERGIQALYPRADIIIHQDPLSVVAQEMRNVESS